MNIDDLIEYLEDMREKHGSDVQILAAIQPTYPLAVEVSGVKALTVDSTGDVVEEWEFERRKDDDLKTTVWIVTGSQAERPYAPREVFGE